MGPWRRHRHGVVGPSGRPRILPVLVVLVVLALLVGSWCGAASKTIPYSPPPEDATWYLDFDTLRSPYDRSSMVTTMVLSDDGETLVLGTDSGAVLYLDAASGDLLGSFETPSHGAVRSIGLDETGHLAVLVYENGYTAAVHRDRPTALLSLGNPDGSPVHDRDQLGAAFSPDGTFLVVTGENTRLFRLPEEEDEGFVPVADHRGGGPFIWFHPDLHFFGVLSRDGTVRIFSYARDALQLEGVLELGGSSEIVEVAISGDGERFAILRGSGSVVRYTPMLHPTEPRLVPDYRDQLSGTPLGIHLDDPGDVIAAWSTRELVWADGCNENRQTCDDAADADRTRLRLRPPLGMDVESAAVTADLSRAVLQVAGDSDGRSRIVYNLPDFNDRFTLAASGTHTGPALLSPDGQTLYRADGARLSARTLTPEEIPPPDESGDPDGDAHTTRLLGLTPTTILAGGIGLLGLLVLVVLGALLLSMRRQEPQAMPSLASDEPLPDLRVPPAAGAVGVPGRIRTVPASAPATPPAPDGLLVHREVTAQIGDVHLAGLDLVIKRPQVLRVHGPRPSLTAWSTLLQGDAAHQGDLAVGGASAREMAVLFRRRIRIGLGALPDRNDAAATLFQKVAAQQGLPTGVAERRMQKDLGWMGDRLSIPFARLRPLDQWKVRLALALVDRPQVLVLDHRELPWANGERIHTLRQVLDGVARHYGMLVVLLDDRTGDTDRVRRLADEEVRLEDRFSERTLLQDGRPVP